jgi:hypothetical protein
LIKGYYTSLIHTINSGEYDLNLWLLHYPIYYPDFITLIWSFIIYYQGTTKDPHISLPFGYYSLLFITIYIINRSPYSIIQSGSLVILLFGCYLWHLSSTAFTVS